MKIKTARHLFTASAKWRVAKMTKSENFLFFSLVRITVGKKRKASEDRSTPERRPKRHFPIFDLGRETGTKSLVSCPRF